jgi:serine/threonine-protein kinase
MGEVYRAHDTRLDRDVAIKILPTDRPFNETARRRFQREAMAASALNHPNIITIYEINSEDNTDFIVMEYVRGATLASLLKRSRLSLHQVLRYSVQIADAVAKAHNAGIIHRDLKPGNVMITDDGLVKVLDFGLAKFNRNLSAESGAGREVETEDAALTMPGTTSGTFAYMSPEQARGEAVDFRTDIFSFGIVIFQLLCGELPFTGANQLALLHHLHFNPPRDLRELRPEVPDSLAGLISRTLEKEPAKRVQSMAEVASELRRIAREQEMSLSQEPGMVPTLGSFVPPRPVPAGGWWRKRWLWASVGVLGFAALLVVGGRQYLKKREANLSATRQAQELPVEDNPYALYKRAREDLDHFDRQGNLDSAIKLLERAVQLDPQSAASYAALGEAYYFKNRSNPDSQWMKLASDYSNKAVALDDYLASGHVSLGMVEMQSGDSASAEKQFRKAAELDPKSGSPHRWLGVLYQKTGKSEEATKELRRAVAADPNDWKIYMALGVNAYLGARYQDAASNLERAQQLEPESVSVLQNLAAVYHLLERDNDAAAALQRALAIQPSADIYNNLGTIRFYAGHYDEAVPAFEKTVELGANNFDNWANLGDAYRWSSNRKDGAKQAYGHAIQLVREEITKHPDQADLRADLAMYLAKSGDKDGALKELKTLDQAHSKEPNILYLTAIAYELVGDRDRALKALTAAVAAGQSLADIKNEPELVSLRADPRYHRNILHAASNSAR